jgi:hypothetical protein
MPEINPVFINKEDYAFRLVPFSTLIKPYSLKFLSISPYLFIRRYLSRVLEEIKATIT